MNKYLLMARKASVHLKLFPGNLPNFFIIGVQKAGTTTLHHLLSQHPNLTGSSPKETHYFDKYIYQGKSIEWYKKHFVRFSLEKQQFFESTPSYFSVLSVAPQLALRFPEAKLILVLREPISRAFSAWNMYREMFEKRRKDVYREKLHGDKTNPLYKYYIQGRSGFPSFQEAVELEIELLNTGVTHVPGIVKRGLYAQQLSNYLAHFDQDQILIIGFKELANQTQETLNRTCDFLKVSRFSIEGIDRGYKNARSYSSKMDEASRRLLTSFFELPNKDLENLIGSIPQW